MGVGQSKVIRNMGLPTKQTKQKQGSSRGIEQPRASKEKQTKTNNIFRRSVYRVASFNAVFFTYPDLPNGFVFVFGQPEVF